MLTAAKRRKHPIHLRYKIFPHTTLFKALLALCSDESVSSKVALDLSINQIKIALCSQ